MQLQPESASDTIAASNELHTLIVLFSGREVKKDARTEARTPLRRRLTGSLPPRTRQPATAPLPVNTPPHQSGALHGYAHYGRIGVRARTHSRAALCDQRASAAFRVGGFRALRLHILMATDMTTNPMRRPTITYPSSSLSLIAKRERYTTYS